MDYEERKVRVNGIEMNVAVAGKGPVVLLVHGYPDTHQVWRKQIPALVGAGYRVIAPDTRGCGDTEMPAAVADYHIDHLVADLVGLLDALELDRVRLVAHDWGAAISWELAVRHPERVDRYVALSTGHPAAYRRGGFEQRFMGYYTLLFRPPGFPERLLRSANWLGLRTLTGYSEELPQWRSQLLRPGRLSAGLNYYRANWRIFFSGDDTPARASVLGVWSSGDRFLSEGQMRGSARYVAAPFQYVRIEGANHWLQLSGAERLEPLLLDYLK